MYFYSDKYICTFILININIVEAALAGLLGGLSAVYVPIEMRESVKEKATVNTLTDWLVNWFFD